MLAYTFNQDATCLAIGTDRGYQIFTCEPWASAHSCSEGGVGVVELLHSSSLVALVGAGTRPGESTRRLVMLNTRTNTSICELNFSSSVLRVRMNASRLLVVLETRTHIFELSSMKLLHTLETARPASPLCNRSIEEYAPNRLGLADMCVAVGRCHAVLPAAAPGQILFFDALQLHALSTLHARKSALAALAISPCGSRVASASEKGAARPAQHAPPRAGTVIPTRVEDQLGTTVSVHSFPQGELLHAFRRGAIPASIYHLAFSSCLPPHDGAASGAGAAAATAQVWRCSRAAMPISGL
uniref:Autophagy-related protein 18 n=1 Tax=Emiliania huxleyi (strain CCMP1516) TaxID=280463 RepID=A0A0D3K4K9_EMIH1